MAQNTMAEAYELRRLKVARQRREIAAQRGEPVAATCAIAEEQDALHKLSQIRRGHGKG